MSEEHEWVSGGLGFSVVSDCTEHYREKKVKFLFLHKWYKYHLCMALILQMGSKEDKKNTSPSCSIPSCGASFLSQISEAC